ncbi:MAG: RHS repeat-associated core domain-containing protein [Myxococcota bacterium]
MPAISTWIGDTKTLRWHSVLSDINQDGFTDLVRVFMQTPSGVLENCAGSGGPTDPPQRTKVQIQLGGPGSGASALSPPTSQSFVNLMCFSQTDQVEAVLVDINGDGFPDLVQYALNSTSFRFQFALGSAQGFGAMQLGPAKLWPPTVQMQPSKLRILSGDFNGDQRTDFALAVLTGNREVVTFLGDGTAGLLGPTSTAWTAIAPIVDEHFRGASVGDLNGDGYDDVAVLYSTASGTKRIRVATGFGSATGLRALSETTFTPTSWTDRPSNLGTGDPEEDLVLSDVDGDGAAEALLLSTGLSNGQRKFWAMIDHFETTPTYAELANVTPAAAYGSSSPTASPYPMARYAQLAPDLNGDGRGDLLAFYRGSRGTDVNWTYALSSSPLFSDASTPERAQRSRDTSSPFADGRDWYQQWHLAVGDGNGDGIPDLYPWLVSEAGETSQTVVLEQLPGTADVTPPRALQPGPLSYDMFCGRSPTFCTTGQGLCPQNSACGAHGVPSSIQVGLYNRDYVRALVGDVNGDGKSDLLIVDDTLPTVGDRIPLVRAYLSIDDGLPDLLEVVKNGLGATERIAYQITSRVPGAIAPTLTTLVNGVQVPECGGRAALGSTTQPSRDVCGLPQAHPVSVVSRIVTDNGQGEVRSWAFGYRNARTRPGPVLRRQVLGFESVVRTDEQRSIADESVFFQTPALEGLPLMRATRDSATQKPIRIETNNYVQLKPYGTPIVVLSAPDTKTVEEYHFSINGGAVQSALERTVTWTASARDTLGFATGEKTCYSAGLLQECDQKTTSYLSHDLLNYWLSRVGTEVVSTDAGDVLSARRLGYWPGYHSDVSQEERLLIHDMVNAYCPIPAELSSICGPLITTQDAHWVSTVRHIDPVSSAKGYDIYGNVTHQLDPLGRDTVFAYDLAFAQYSASITNPLGQVSRRTYDAMGNVATETDANGQVTTFEFDALSRRSKVLLPLPGISSAAPSERWEYLDVGLTTQRRIHHRRISATDEVWVMDWLDGYGESYATETSSSGAATLQTRRVRTYLSGTIEEARSHAFLRPLGATTVPNPGWVRSAVDAQGRLIAETEDTTAGTVRTRLAVTYLPLQQTLTDAAGNRIVKTYNYRRQLASVTDPLKGITTYRYDRSGNLTQVVRPDGESLSSRFNSFGWEVVHQEPETGTANWQYDDAGNPSYAGTGNGRSMTYQYDALNRVRTQSDDRGRTTTFAYDASSVSNGVGRATSVQYPLGLTTGFGTRNILSYDPLGRVLSSEDRIDGYVVSRSAVYDDLGRITRKYFPDHTPSVPSYQDNVYQLGGGDVRSVSVRFGSTTREIGRFTQYAPTGKLLKWVAAGVTTTDTYDDFKRLTDRRSDGPGSPMMQAYTYGYDAIGNLLSITDKRLSTVIGGVNTDESMAFTFDALSRLKTAHGPSLPSAASFGYDSVGNIQLKDGENRTYAPAGGGRTAINATLASATRWTAYHDAGGNRESMFDVVAQRNWFYDYDALGQLMTATQRTAGLTGGALVSKLDLAYDDAGERVRKIYTDTSGRVTTTYYFGEDYELRQYSGATGVAKTRHIDAPNGQRIASYTDGAVFPGQSVGSLLPAVSSSSWQGSTLLGPSTGWSFAFSNQIGSSSVVTNEAGQVVSRMVYAPFGELIPGKSRGTDVTPRKFAGYELDEESGLHLAGARYYDTRSGRFLTPDSMTPGRGVRAQGLNRFAYSRNNPVTYSDPSGHMESSLSGGIQDRWERAVDLGVGAAKWGTDLVAGFVKGAMPVPSPALKAPFGNERALAMGEVGGALYGLATDVRTGKAGFDIATQGSAVACATGVGCVAVAPVAFAAGVGVMGIALTAGAGHLSNLIEGGSNLLSKSDKEVAGSSGDKSEKTTGEGTPGAEDDKWVRDPQSLQDEEALDAAKQGQGEVIIPSLSDPQFKGMEKMELKVKSANGRDSVVHYVRDPKSGNLFDFKFKKSSVDGDGDWAKKKDPKSGPTGSQP